MNLNTYSIEWLSFLTIFEFRNLHLMRDARTYMDCIFEEKMEIDLKMVDREAGQFLVLAGLVRSAGLASQHQKLPSLSIYHF